MITIPKMASGGCNPEFIVRNKHDSSNPKYTSNAEIRSEVSGK